MRSELRISKTASPDEARAMAEADDKIRNILDGKEVPNYIYTYICLWVWLYAFVLCIYTCLYRVKADDKIRNILVGKEVGNYIYLVIHLISMLCA